MRSKGFNIGKSLYTVLSAMLDAVVSAGDCSGKGEAMARVLKVHSRCILRGDCHIHCQKY
jgi:hypothetical protein